MNGFSILMFIFSFLIFLCGIYLFTGHKNEILLWKVHDIKNFTIEQTKNVGKWTMIASLVPLVLGILGLIFGWE
ncbi:MAG: hypothetical protein IJL74_01260 [Bacilli bacterium]|nr:hypothetical protein [Bacilli bacterium]